MPPSLERPPTELFLPEGANPAPPNRASKTGSVQHRSWDVFFGKSAQNFIQGLPKKIASRKASANIFQNLTVGNDTVHPPPRAEIFAKKYLRLFFLGKLPPPPGVLGKGTRGVGQTPTPKKGGEGIWDALPDLLNTFSGAKRKTFFGRSQKTFHSNSH